MREIKFRAYVNNPIHGKGVFPVKSIHFNPFVCEVIIGDETVTFFDFDNIVLLEYTGLRDKNKKEIYEGDIVKYSDWEHKEIIYGIEGFAGFGLKGTLAFLMDYDAENMEVIGNIYEHPHLLETEN
jgi:uncharacterized phage protein (TIGR01671 family)